MTIARLLCAIGFVLVSAATGIADELRPALLSLREFEANRFHYVWKVPMQDDMRLALAVEMPPACKPDSQKTAVAEAGSNVERQTVACDGGLAGGRIAIAGLRGSSADVIARIEWADGSTQVERLNGAYPSFQVTSARTKLGTATTYAVLGIDHILTSLDHLLFVLALVLLIDSRWLLVKTITTFTIAHSITLAGATLGMLSLPQKPVEILIALSICFLAADLVKSRPGNLQLSETRPWLVSFTFGLLHGLGFAGALKEIGLPQKDVPLALLAFNIGVEIGQVLFIAALLLGGWAFARLFTVERKRLRVAVAYVIGSIAAAWVVLRAAAI